MQGLEARKAGEQSRADSLRVSIGQLATLPDEDAGTVEEPKRSPGAAMIGAGAAVAVLMFVIAPVMAVVAVAGAILAALGVVSRSGYQTKLKAYEAYRASAAQRQETQKKKTELQTQLDAAERSVSSLQEQLDGLNRDIQMEQAEENDKVHVAEGYSTGSCDLIDFCMRLALVDTLFESEQPFLILDDPFVNLDAERMDKALELLNVMAASKQIVYFVCHPIRAVEAKQDSDARAEFVRLAETARKTIASRSSMRGARKRPVRKSPKELYHVVNPDGVVAIRPAKSGDTITNSIFSLRFVLSDPGITRDHSYELFFIDATGHVMNDRQLIEIKNGKLSTERVQFCLNTRDDSGSQYELMIRESGQDDYEVVARIPYKAKLAFAGTFSFDL